MPLPSNPGFDQVRLSSGILVAPAVDGGITTENIGEAVRAGANVIVAGRRVFCNGSVAENLAALRTTAIASISI